MLPSNIVFVFAGDNASEGLPDKWCKYANSFHRGACVFVVVVVVFVFVFHNRYTRIDLAFYNTSIKSLGLVIRKATNHRVEFRKPINANPGLKKNISENLTEKLQN